jgi:hypothetical protein
MAGEPARHSSSVYHTWSDCPAARDAAGAARAPARAERGERMLCPRCALRSNVTADIERELRRTLRLPARDGSGRPV